MRKLVTILLLTISTLLQAQELDSCVQTDIIQSRFNIGGSLNFPVLKTDLSFTPERRHTMNFDGSISRAMPSKGIEISQDYRLKDRKWLQIGITYAVYHYDYKGFAQELHDRLSIPLTFFYDLSNSEYPFMIGGGVMYTHILTKELTHYDNLQYPPWTGPGETYTHRRNVVELFLRIGKLIKVDETMALRIEGLVGHTAGSSIQAPNKGSVMSLGLKASLTTFFHKVKKVGGKVINER